MHTYGVSFSLKQCRSFDINPHDCLEWLISEGGFRRFRLMSYWNEHEQQPGVYDFKELDWQVARIAEIGGTVTLCLGARQPRWPENHWPDWAWQLPKPERSTALLRYIEVVVERYKDTSVIVSYQLENEALLKQFGERAEVDRKRLRAEYKLIKQLDPYRPVVMTTSTSWGVPLRSPVPDIVGFSYYQVLYNKGRYSTALHTPFIHRVRAWINWMYRQRTSFIHELQMEPWGPANIWEMSFAEQDTSMSPAQIKKNMALAKAVRTEQIDIWGGEWWYWRTVIMHDASSWNAVKTSIVD